MSPPKVSTDKCWTTEKSDNQTPVLVTCKQQNKVSKKWMICAVFALFVFLSTTISVLIAWNLHLFSEKDFDRVTEVGGVKLIEHIHVDYPNHLIYTKDNGTDRIHRWNTLYDYNQKIKAYKDLILDSCFLSEINKTFDKDLEIFASHDVKHKLPVKNYCLGQLLSQTIKDVAGGFVAKHCQDISTFWLDEINDEVAPVINKKINGEIVKLHCGSGKN